MARKPLVPADLKHRLAARRQRGVVRVHAAATGEPAAVTMQVMGGRVYMLTATPKGRAAVVMDTRELTRLLAEAGSLLLQVATVDTPMVTAYEESPEWLSAFLTAVQP